MILSYQYRLRPTYAQRCEMTRWLEMLRAQYNWLLADRFDWWEMNRTAVNACPLVSSIAEPRDRPNYYSQQAALVGLKAERPWYRDVCAQTLQEMVRRVDRAFERFIVGDSNGNRSGKPRFKGKNRYRTFTFPQLKPECVQGNRIILPKLGAIKLVLHRPIPEGMVIKQARVTLKADGWFITLVLEDKAIPAQPQSDVVPTLENSIGVDAGLEYFLACSDGTLVEPPKFFRRSEERLGALQAKREQRPKGSKARRKLNERIAKLHQRIAHQRRQFHFEQAGKLVERAEVIFVEDLKVANMGRRNKAKQADDGTFLPNGQAAKSGLNKSFADAGIAGFLNQILPYKAAKAGRRVVKVNPAGTSQHCANCLNRVPKELKDRWHSCPECGVQMQRDLNSALLIQKVGLGIASLKNAKSRPRRDGEARPLRAA
jgi:putative transposase